jgi:hypothetical protein
LEEALDTIIAPVEVNPFCCAETHDHRVCGISVSSINKIFSPKTTIKRKHERIDSSALQIILNPDHR